MFPSLKFLQSPRTDVRPCEINCERWHSELNFDSFYVELIQRLSTFRKSRDLRFWKHRTRALSRDFRGTRNVLHFSLLHCFEISKLPELVLVSYHQLSTVLQILQLPDVPRNFDKIVTRSIWNFWIRSIAGNCPLWVQII